MTGYARRPIALLLTCLFSGGAAQAASLAGTGGSLNLAELDMEPPRVLPAMNRGTQIAYKDAAVVAPLALRPSKKMPPRTPKSEEPQPYFLIADHIEGQTDEKTLAEGNAELRKADTLLFSDRMTYHALDDEIEADGNVRLEQEGVEVKGPYLRLKMTDQMGYFERASYRINRWVKNSNNDDSPAPGLAEPLPTLPLRLSTAYGEAERINFEGENQFRIERGTYSTCTPDQMDWFAKGSEIKLDYDQNQGAAYHTAVYFKDIPFAYSPYFSFPLNNERKSGILAPTFSSSTRTGFDLSVPYYWNIAPNYDATFTPRYMVKRGAQLGTEVRYMDPFAHSQAQFEYMSRDKQYGDRRYAYNLKHVQTLGAGFSTNIDWNGVSDDEYFTDLSSRVVQTTQRQLPKDFSLSYGQTWWTATLQTLRYQTLNPGDEVAVDQPYSIEPRLSFSARVPEWHGLDISTIAQYTKFSHDTDVEGERMVAYPSVSLPFIRPGYYITPKIGVHATTYKLKNQDAGVPDTLQRVLPIFSLDAGMTFERSVNLVGQDWTQTLEPRLYYLRVPYKDQSDIPIFDTGLADFNFGQIFSESRFSGYDRLSNANQLTAALTSRLIDPLTGAERIRGMIGQRYYFSDLRVGLPGEDLKRDSFSTLLTAFSGQIAPRTYVDTAWEYDFNNSTNERFYIGGRFQPDYGKVLSVAYRYNRGIEAQDQETLDQIDVATQWKLSGRWHVVGRYNYALDTSRLVEGIAGLEYNAGCWAGRFVVQRLETTSGDPNTSFFFQLELNDFGQVGSNPIQTLRRSIPGYSKINELPSGSLLSED